MKKIASIITISTTLIPLTANAECVPVPDCASIGYTKTSCEGDSLKCPFDSAKLKCLPCVSSFRYSCTGDKVKNPIGTACNNKYAACECVAGATFTNGECICDTSCDTIGNIVYSDRTCSSCFVENKTAVAVVVNKGLITPLNTPSIKWSSRNSNVTDLEDLSTKDLAKIDTNGFDNSQKIRVYFASDNETNNATWYCYNLEVEGFEEYNNQWYLPSIGEIYNYFHQNYDKINRTITSLGYININRDLWSSSECSAVNTWTMNPYIGNYSRNYLKEIAASVKCLLRL